MAGVTNKRKEFLVFRVILYRSVIEFENTPLVMLVVCVARAKRLIQGILIAAS